MIDRFKTVMRQMRPSPPPAGIQPGSDFTETEARDVMRKLLSMGYGSSVLFGQNIPDIYWPSLTPELGTIGNYNRDPAQHSVVSAIIRLLGDAVGGTGFQLRERVSEGKDQVVTNHPMMRALRSPNPEVCMTWRELATCMVDGLICNGNAYIAPVSPSELRYLDWRNIIQPTYSQMYYQYRDPWTNGVIKYGMDELIHLRFQRGPDGINGIGPLRSSVLREISTDITAQQYTDTLLRRMGVPGVIGMPEGDDIITQDNANAIMKSLDSSYTGGNRGRAAVFTHKLKFVELGGAMQRADLRTLRWVPEERICSACGVPPAVLNIGTGSEQSRVGATLRYLLQQYWVGTVQPMMHLLAEQLSQQLMPLYIRDVDRFFLEPNFEQSTVLSELYAEMRRAQMEAAVYGYKNGMIGFVEAREMAGLPAEMPKDLLTAEPPTDALENEEPVSKIWQEALAEAQGEVADEQSD